MPGSRPARATASQISLHARPQASLPSFIQQTPASPPSQLAHRPSPEEGRRWNDGPRAKWKRRAPAGKSRRARQAARDGLGPPLPQRTPASPTTSSSPGPRAAHHPLQLRAVAEAALPARTLLGHSPTSSSAAFSSLAARTAPPQRRLPGPSASSTPAVSRFLVGIDLPPQGSLSVSCLLSASPGQGPVSCSARKPGGLTLRLARSGRSVTLGKTGKEQPSAPQAHPGVLPECPAAAASQHRELTSPRP